MSKQYLQTVTLQDAHPTDIFSLASTSSHLITVSGSSTIRIYSTRGQTIHADSADEEVPYPIAQTLDQVHKLGCHHVCTSLDGKSAASVGFAGGDVKVWQCSEDGVWSEKGEILVDEKSAGEHWACALNEDGKYLACTTIDGRIHVYDTSTIADGKAEKVTTYETQGSFGMSIDISSNGEMTASGHQNGSTYIFNNSTRRLARSLSGLVKAVRAVRFSPANRYLAAAGDSRVIALYDTQSGEQVANFTGHGAWVMSLDWNFSGQYLLSGAYDGKVKIWDLERKECVATQTESDKCLWAVKWLYHAPTARTQTFVTAGAGKTLAFYREASGA